MARAPRISSRRRFRAAAGAWGAASGRAMTWRSFGIRQAGAGCPECPGGAERRLCHLGGSRGPTSPARSRISLPGGPPYDGKADPSDSLLTVRKPDRPKGPKHAPLRSRHYRFRIGQLADHTVLGRQAGGGHRRRRFWRHLPECWVHSDENVRLPGGAGCRPRRSVPPWRGPDAGGRAVDRDPRPDLRPHRRDLGERPPLPGRRVGQRGPLPGIRPVHRPPVAADRLRDRDHRRPGGGGRRLARGASGRSRHGPPPGRIPPTL